MFDKFKTLEMCKKAVIKDPYALEYVLVKLKTLEMCGGAVTENPWTLEYVPDKISLEMRKQSLKILMH